MEPEYYHCEKLESSSIAQCINETGHGIKVAILGINEECVFIIGNWPLLESHRQTKTHNNNNYVLLQLIINCWS